MNQRVETPDRDTPADGYGVGRDRLGRFVAGDRVCSIQGCGRVHKSLGWCRLHYERFKQNGDPQKGKRLRGAALHHFLDEVLAYKGDGCLTWPYKRATSGYARLWYQGRYQNVSRLVCAEEHGPSPTEAHEAAHSCGKGHEGCVARHHVSWKTPKENAADRLTHGTHNRGDRHGAAKLTEAAAREILFLKDHPQSEIAAKFGVSTSTISAIRRGKAWSWIGQ